MLSSFPPALFFVLIGVSFLSTPAYAGDALLFVLPMALVVAVLMHILLRYRAHFSAAILLLYSVAYFVGSQLPLDEGFPGVMSGVRPESARAGLAVSVAFMTAISLSALIARRLAPVVWASEQLRRVCDYPNEQLLKLALLALGALFMVSAFATNSWTFYGGGEYSGEDSSMALELAYMPMLFLAVSGATWRLLLAWFDRRSVRQWLMVGVFFLVSIFLAFMMQSRRLVIGSLTLGAAAAASSMPTRSNMRASAAAVMVIAGGGMLLAFLMWGSYRWRATSNDGGESVGARLEAFYEGSSTATSEEDPLTAGLTRFTYLWMEGITQEYGGDLDAPYDLLDLLASKVALATPRALFPGKTEVETITCEELLIAVVSQDLPCTPISEGLAVGGWGTLALVAASWGIFFAVVDRLLLAATTGPVLLAIAIGHPFVFVEVGVAPWVHSFRLGALVVGMAMLSSLPRLLRAGRSERGVAGFTNQA